jgi:hypothetical protein
MCTYETTDPNNIKMDLKEIRREVVDWVHLAQDSVLWLTFVNTGVKGWKIFESLSDRQFVTSILLHGTR